MGKFSRLIAITLGLSAYGCMWTPPDMNLNVECAQLRPASNMLSLDGWDSNNNLGGVHDIVRRMQLKYERRGFWGATYFTTPGSSSVAHVLLLVTEPVREAADLPIPQAGNDVVYLFQNGHWQAYPMPVANASSHSLRVRPDKKNDGGFDLDVTGMGIWNHIVELRPTAQ
jgi:hypothetical protein